MNDDTFLQGGQPDGKHREILTPSVYTRSEDIREDILNSRKYREYLNKFLL